MANEPKKIVSISTAKKKIMGTINVDGVDHEVHQLDFDTNQMLEETEGTAKYIGAIRLAAAKVCPTLSAETIGQLGIDDGTAIVLFAGGGVRAVEVMFPNVVSPETPTSPG